MAKKNGWPTQSKGIFYPGYGRAQSESRSAGERDMKFVSPRPHRTERGSHYQGTQAKRPWTADSMRRPK